MAAPLSQDEIDSILGSSGDFDFPASDDISGAAASEPPKSSSSRFYSIPLAEPYRFRFPYHSPIVKKYLYNPGSAESEDNPVPVVWSITHYAQKLK